MASQELILVNPRSRRKRRSSSTRRRRTYARRNPVRRTVAKRNPTRKRRSAAYSRSTPVRRSRRRYGRVRRYTSRARVGFSRFRASNIGSFVSSKLVPASVGAFGALGLDLLWGALPIPDSLKSGMLAPVARIGGAILIGYGVGAVAGRKVGEEAMSGAVIVTLYDLFKTTLKANTSLPLSGMGYMSTGMIVGNQGDYNALNRGNWPGNYPALGMYVGEDADPDVFKYDTGYAEFTGSDHANRDYVGYEYDNEN